MSARTLRRVPRRRPAAAVTPIDVLAALLNQDSSSDTAKLLPLAERELPALLARGLESGYIEEAAIEVLNRSGDELWLERAAKVEQLYDALGPAADAIGTVRYSLSEASFWLGFMAGLKLHGVGSAR